MMIFPKDSSRFTFWIETRCTQEAYETHRGHLPSSMMAVPYGTELQEMVNFTLAKGIFAREKTWLWLVFMVTYA